MKAVTVTLNPSFDTTLFLDSLHPDRANRVLSETTEAGGKGINVARVINSLGAQVLAFCLVGTEDKERFSDLLDRNEMFHLFEREGKTRENLTLRADNKCMKVNRRGEQVAKEILKAFEDEVINAVEPGDMVVISGSSPIGYEKNDLVEFCKRLKSRSARIVLDTDLDLESLKMIRPFMIKPNEYEIVGIVGETDSLNEAAKKCFDAGVENVLITLGEKGMLAVVSDEEYYVSPAKIKAKSTVGAGDSAVAGFVAGVILEMDTSEILRLSAAAGTATAMCEGTRLAEKELIVETHKNTKVIKNI